MLPNFIPQAPFTLFDVLAVDYIYRWMGMYTDLRRPVRLTMPPLSVEQGQRHTWAHRSLGPLDRAITMRRLTCFAIRPHLTIMGIKGLWTALEPAQQKISIHRWAVQQGFMSNKGGRRAMQIGIDVSGWIYRAEYRHGRTRNPELAALFARCARLLMVPILPVFVFDGPGRPGRKRDKKVRGTENWLVSDVKEMLDCFGFPWVQAPGEAEAQLAWMSSQGMIDAVLTDDSDAIVFGTPMVLRILSEDNGPYTASLYSAESIGALGLGPAELLLIAILVGGDYSPGLPGCGMTTAIGMAKAGFGQKLIQALAGSESLLYRWRQDLAAELRENKLGYLSRCQPKLAGVIPNTFPDLETIDLYRRPLVNSQLMMDQFRSSPLNPVALAVFCEHRFVWRSGILRKFASTIFPGLATRELIDHAVALDSGLVRHPIAPTYLRDVVFRRDSPLSPGLSELRINLAVDPKLIADICRAVTAATRLATIPEPVERMRAWLPVVMVRHVFPGINMPNEDSDLFASSRSRALRALETLETPHEDPHDVIEILSSPEPQDVIELSSSPEPQDYEDKRYTTTTTYSASGQVILEFDTDSDGSL